jgi:hypothetical protein
MFLLGLDCWRVELGPFFLSLAGSFLLLPLGEGEGSAQNKCGRWGYFEYSVAWVCFEGCRCGRQFWLDMYISGRGASPRGFHWVACLACFWLWLGIDGFVLMEDTHRDSHTDTFSLCLVCISLLRCDTSLDIRRLSLSWFILVCIHHFSYGSIYTGQGISACWRCLDNLHMEADTDMYCWVSRWRPRCWVGCSGHLESRVFHVCIGLLKANIGILLCSFLVQDDMPCHC